MGRSCKHSHTLNRTPSSRDKTKTSFESFKGEKPYVSNSRILGQKVVIKKKTVSGKFDSKGSIGFMIGYTNMLNTYRVFDLNKNTIIITSDVRFLP